jgi:hypothetical protein
LVPPALQDEPRRSRGVLGPSLAENRPKTDQKLKYSILPKTEGLPRIPPTLPPSAPCLKPPRPGCAGSQRVPGYSWVLEALTPTCSKPAHRLSDHLLSGKTGKLRYRFQFSSMFGRCPAKLGPRTPPTGPARKRLQNAPRISPGNQLQYHFVPCLCSSPKTKI